MHTNASDGQFSPRELIRLAREAGLRTVAITDHDTTGGVAEALEAGRELEVEVVPGIELSTTVEAGEIHMLGLWIDHEDLDLRRMTRTMQGGRDAAARQMVENLRTMGMDGLRFERVRELAGESSIGRPAIARAMLEGGYIERFEDAFTAEYLAHDGKAYVPRHKLSPEDAVRLIRKAGGLAVLAHPTYTHDLPRALAGLWRAGLDGLEVYYRGYDPATRARLRALGRRFGLLWSGGSDYHGVPAMGDAPLGRHFVPQAVLDALRTRHARRGGWDASRSPAAAVPTSGPAAGAR